MIKKSSFSRMRKRLSDITNLSSQHKSPLKDQENMVSAVHDSSTKNYVQQLLKENAVMMKLIQEKDKIIEMSGVEMQKLRVSLQRTQLQNLQLAQSNTHMLTELNLGKDRLKILQHELSSKDALYKAKMLDLQEKAKMQCEANSVQEGEAEPEKVAVEQHVQGSNHNKNKVSKSKRERPTRSQSLGPMTSQQATDKEIAENKRRCLRRQSVRLKPQEAKADMFEINVNTPVVMIKEEPHRQSNSEWSTGNKDCVSQASNHSAASQRTSIGRPMRRSVAKVQSYKEKPLNVKMRRPE